MNYQEQLTLSFLEELEQIKTAALRVPKETRKAWFVGSSRKGRRSMSVSTMLRKEKDGTLGGYKLAAAYDPPTRLSEEALKSLPARIHPKVKTDKPPTAEDSGTATPSKENTREFAYTEQPRSTTLMNVGTSTYPADRT